MMETRKSCGMGHDLLQEFLDGELSAWERGSVVEHLHGCTACSSEVAGYRRLCERLSLMPLLSPGADFDRVVLSAVLRRTDAVLGISPVGWLAVAYLVASLGLAVVALVLVGPPIAGGPMAYFAEFWKGALHAGLAGMDRARDMAELAGHFVNASWVVAVQLRVALGHLALAANTQDGRLYLILMVVTALGFFRLARRSRKGGPIVHAAF